MNATDCSDLLHRCSFPPAGTSVVCAVSGGPDSMALMVLAVAADLDVTATHVDHGLRPGSDLEAEVVRTAAGRFGAGFEALVADVADGPNLEARAREARHRALPEGALLGHTMDDQAETVVLNLLRGAGSAGLAGMRVAERDVVPILARQAELFASESDVMDDLASALDVEDAAALAAAPVAVARRAVRAFIIDATGAGHPPDAATVERALSVARLDVTATDLGQGWRLARTDGRLRIERG